MNLSNLKDFEDELYMNLKKLEIENPSGCVRYIINLLKALRNRDNLENIIKEELEFLLEKKTDEIVDVICNFFNIKRTYGLSQNSSVSNNFGSSNDISNKSNGHENNVNNTCFENKSEKSFCRKNLYGVKKRNLKHSRISRGISRLKWNDIARSIKSVNNSRKIDLPCSTFLEKGFCIDGDSCKFTHGKAMLVKPRKVLLNSFYNTGHATTINSSEFILPNHDDSIPHRDKVDVISVSSLDSDPECARFSSIPTAYTPPSMFDSPLWYKELGYLVETTDSKSDSDSSKSKSKNSLVVSDIPPELNRIGVLNKHFRKFGTLRNVEVQFNGDPKCALIQYVRSRDAYAANKSPEAILCNRFIKTRIYKDKQKFNEKRRNRKKSRRGSRERNKKSSRKRSRKKKRNSRNTVSQSASPQVRSRESSLQILPNDPDVVTINQTPSTVKVERTSRVFEDQLMDQPIDQFMDMGQPETITAVVATDDSRETQQVVDIATSYQQSVQTDDLDLKLERALNDSDVDSVDSADSISHFKRQALVDQRRMRLRKENKKNSSKSKLQRLDDSIGHYKSLLESLIAEFKVSDKIKKAILIRDIKENHSRFVELKELRLKMRESIQLAQNPNRDSVQGEINQLQTSIVSQLTVTNGNDKSNRQIYLCVPASVVLYPDQVFGLIEGPKCVIENFEMVACSTSTVVYVVTMEKSEIAYQAFNKLMSRKPLEWKVSMEVPDDLNK